jgi:hypothetical protein
MVNLDDLGALAGRASVLGAPVVAVELQWGLDEGPRMTCSWCLELCAIVASPGMGDSRFSSVELARRPAETPGERAHARLLAGRLA